MAFSHLQTTWFSTTYKKGQFTRIFFSFVTYCFSVSPKLFLQK